MRFLTYFANFVPSIIILPCEGRERANGRVIVNLTKMFIWSGWHVSNGMAISLRITLQNANSFMFRTMATKIPIGKIKTSSTHFVSPPMFAMRKTVKSSSIADLRFLTNSEINKKERNRLISYSKWNHYLVTQIKSNQFMRISRISN